MHPDDACILQELQTIMNRSQQKRISETISSLSRKRKRNRSDADDASVSAPPTKKSKQNENNEEHVVETTPGCDAELVKAPSPKKMASAITMWKERRGIKNSTPSRDVMLALKAAMIALRERRV